MAHRGDVFPYVPIAAELSRRGHEVTYVVPREFHPQLSGEQFRCVHSGTDFSPIELDDCGPFIARWGNRLGGAMLLRLYFGRFTVPHLPALFEAIDHELANADVLVSHPAASIVGAMSCERRGLPWIVGDLFPMLVPTSNAPPAAMPNLGKRVNKALWRLGGSRVVDPFTSRRDFVKFRKGLGLDTSRDWNVVDARLSPYRNLGLASRHYVHIQPDWPANYDLVGFTSWHGPDGGHLPADVVAFLADGPPPVIVTLGSSGASARPEVFEQVAAFLDQVGERGVFLTSNEVITDRVRAAGVGPPHGVWPFVALEPLLPHARALVQSGAHGTNALALEAGIPSVIVPSMFDQQWHARRQEQLGTGIWARRQRDLPNALRRLLNDASMADRAHELATKMQSEHGVTAACDEIEAFLARG
jgi:UDP:flavonoid glycosyltransferase YjiC (YdhE family)